LKVFFRNHWQGTIWALFILVLTGIPGNYFPQVVTFLQWASPDKIVHLFIFGVWSFLLMNGNKRQYFSGKTRSVVGVAIISGIIYGGLTELFQHYVFIRRDGNIFDFLANVVGTLLGVGVFILLNRKKLNRKEIFSE
jgi:VanZ family protein